MAGVAVMAFMAVVSVVSCSPGRQWRQERGAVWNTVYCITYEADHDCGDSIRAVFRQVEASLSPFAENSLISRINRNETAIADTLFRKVFGISSQVCRKSAGRFDPTVSPLVNLWKFGYTGKVDSSESWEPSPQQIDSAMRYVGILECSISSSGELVKKDPGTTFNFSALTKGYACDLVADILARNGAVNAMVEIGGDVALRGKSPRGDAWRLQIDVPADEDGAPRHEPLEIIEATDCGVATSGNYRNFHQSSRGKVGHTIDPVTGYPQVTDLLSVTVVAPSCVLADAYATAALASPSVMAADSVLRLAGVKGILVEADTLSARGFSVRHIP